MTKFNMNPIELKGYLSGVEAAIQLAKRYKGIDMKNYIGELEEIMHISQHIPGYQDWLKQQGKSDE